MVHEIQIVAVSHVTSHITESALQIVSTWGKESLYEHLCKYKNDNERDLHSVTMSSDPAALVVGGKNQVIRNPFPYMTFSHRH